MAGTLVVRVDRHNSGQMLRNAEGSVTHELRNLLIEYQPFSQMRSALQISATGSDETTPRASSRSGIAAPRVSFCEVSDQRPIEREPVGIRCTALDIMRRRAWVRASA